MESVSPIGSGEELFESGLGDLTGRVAVNADGDLTGDLQAGGEFTLRSSMAGGDTTRVPRI